MLLTPARRQFATRWPWIGAAVAAAIMSPNVIWQATNGWPSLEFYRNAALNKNQPIGPLQVFGQQLTTMSPGTIPVWLAGLVLLLRRRVPADLRHLGLAFLILLGMLMASGQSRPDRITGIYPLLFAAGGVAIGAAQRDTPVGRRRPPWRGSSPGAWRSCRWASRCLPPGPLASYSASLGLVPQLERGEGKRSALPQWFADRLGWDALIDDVAAVRDALPDARAR